MSELRFEIVRAMAIVAERNAQQLIDRHQIANDFQPTVRLRGDWGLDEDGEAGDPPILLGYRLFIGLRGINASGRPTFKMRTFPTAVSEDHLSELIDAFVDNFSGEISPA